MTSPTPSPDTLDSQFADTQTARSARHHGPALYDAVDQFWTAVYRSPHLSPRMKELVLLALHAASSALNADAIARHVRRALQAGATQRDVADVLTTILPLANHPVYVGIPVLMDELAKAGQQAHTQMPGMRADVAALKEDFVSRRGYWTPMRDVIGCWMPEYFTAFINACMEPWESGSLTPAERELMYIAIDCSITHTYEPGLRMHIQNALRYGVSRDQILEVFQLAALLGTEGCVLGLQAMAQDTDATSPDTGAEVACVAVSIAKAEHVNEVKQALEALIEPVRRERGVLQYEMFQAPDDPRRFVFFERWRSAEDFRAHCVAPHINACHERTAGLIEHAEFHQLKRVR